MKNVTFLLTNQCNLRCKHCFVAGGEEKTIDLTPNEKFKAIDHLCLLGCQKIVFSGGEPLLEHQLFEYITYARSKGLKIGLLSNGILLNKTLIDIICTEVNTLSLSLYTEDILGVAPDQYSKYLSKIFEVFEYLTKKKYPFKITIPVTNTNPQRIKYLISSLRRDNIQPKTVRLFVVTPIGRGNQNRTLCTENANCSDILDGFLDETCKRSLNICYEYTKVPYGHDTQERFLTKCPMLDYSSEHFALHSADPHMDANGDLYLCGLLIRNREFCIGNVVHDSVGDIKENVDGVVAKLNQKERKDCCPALDRNAEDTNCLVCPIVYSK